MSQSFIGWLASSWKEAWGYSAPVTPTTILDPRNIALTVRSAVAKAAAVLNHAEAQVTSPALQAQALSQVSFAGATHAMFGVTASAPELLSATHSQVLTFSAALDEHNLWGVT